eukprot:259782-Prorocentrum_minimum.AAC.4
MEHLLLDVGERQKRERLVVSEGERTHTSGWRWQCLSRTREGQHGVLVEVLDHEVIEDGVARELLLVHAQAADASGLVPLHGHMLFLRLRAHRLRTLLSGEAWSPVVNTHADADADARMRAVRGARDEVIKLRVAFCALTVQNAKWGMTCLWSVAWGHRVCRTGRLGGQPYPTGLLRRGYTQQRVDEIGSVRQEWCAVGVGHLRVMRDPGGANVQDGHIVASALGEHLGVVPEEAIQIMTPKFINQNGIGKRLGRFHWPRDRERMEGDALLGNGVDGRVVNVSHKSWLRVELVVSGLVVPREVLLSERPFGRVIRIEQHLIVEQVTHHMCLVLRREV